MKILFLNQCFYPDVVATAQHLSEAAAKLARRGHTVTAIASHRGSDNPALRFPGKETWRNVRILRVPVMAFGKQNKLGRIVNALSFWIMCTLRLLTLGRQDIVIAATAPPLLPVLASAYTRLTGARFVLWLMDMNPDEAVAVGYLRESSLLYRILSAFSNYSLRSSDCIVVLDRFMRDRVLSKGAEGRKIAVIPPWSLDDIQFDAVGRARFRRQHKLEDKFVVMYSGNHSPCHPLDTIMQTARELAAVADIAFCFVGGGREFERVQRFSVEHRLTNVRCLGYQPLAELAGSLSAADLHVVIMGDAFAGIVHPCKIYNILAVNRPFLYIGPAHGPIADVGEQLGPDSSAYMIRHRDVGGAVAAILEAKRTAASQQPRSYHQLRTSSKDLLLSKFVAVVEGFDNVVAPQVAPKLQISASIVLYKNGQDAVSAAVTSFLSSSLQVGLTVIDNSPSDALRKTVEDLGANYHFVNRNVGFGAGHNIAIREYIARSEYHLILNPDVHFDSKILVRLYDFMQANRKVGLVMPRVLYPDGSEQHLCKMLPKPLDLISRRFGGWLNRKFFQSRTDRYLLKSVNVALPRIVPCLSGCFMLARSETLKMAGLFDERYFMYMEDVDLCRRIGDLAYTVFFPSVAIVHEYAKGSYRNHRLLKFHVQSAWCYFCKWGWFRDPTRDRLNTRGLDSLNLEFPPQQ